MGSFGIVSPAWSFETDVRKSIGEGRSGIDRFTQEGFENPGRPIATRPSAIVRTCRENEEKMGI